MIDVLIFWAAFAIRAGRCAMPLNATLFIGSPPDGVNMTQVPILIDPFYEHTLVSSSQFTCAKITGCWLEPEYHKETYRNYSFIYRVGHTRMNVLNFQFNQTAVFHFVVNGTDTFGSILGFQKGSDFLEYYHDENKRMNFDMMLRVGPENKVFFIKDIPKNFIELKEEKYEAKLHTNQGAAFEDKPFKFCINPIYDYLQNSKSWFGVKEEHKNRWKQFLTTNDDSHNKMLTLSLLQDETDVVANLTFDQSNLIDAQANNYFSTFDETFSNDCDVITGTYMLKFLNYSIYYIDSQDDYRLKSLIWLKDFQNAKQGFTIWNLIVILVLLVILGTVCFYGYKYYFWQEPEGRISDEYRSIGIEMNETKDNAILGK